MPRKKSESKVSSLWGMPGSEKLTILCTISNAVMRYAAPFQKKSFSLIFLYVQNNIEDN